METEFSERLINVLEKKRLKKKLEGDLKAILDDLSAQTSRLDDLSAQLNREKVDVEKLESNSLAAIFYTVLGSREAQLEKERQEMLRAQLVYQNTKHQVASLEGERNYLLRQLARLEGVEFKYETLLSDKEAYLRSSNPVVANKLVEISEQVANLNAEIKEIDEAIDVGSQVVLGLVQVLGSLNSAKSWGVWDMVGGGFLSTAVKHSRIDEARERVTQVQELMTRFKRELADIRQSMDIHIEVSGLETFADYFMDGLIFDWVVQSKIMTALERTNQVKANIEDTIKNLSKQKSANLLMLADIQANRTHLLETT